MNEKFKDTPLFAGNPVLSGLENMLERQINASSAAAKAARKLDGKTLALEFTGLSLTVFAKVSDGKINLSTEFDEDADVIISGSPLAMLAFAQTRDSKDLSGGGIKFTGDVGIAMDFQSLFTLAAPDIEGELARLVGDETASQIGSTMRGLFDWGRSSFEQFGGGLGEFLTRENGDIPQERDLETFCDEVDALRADTDRAQARLSEIIRKSE